MEKCLFWKLPNTRWSSLRGIYWVDGFDKIYNIGQNQRTCFVVFVCLHFWQDSALFFTQKVPRFNIKRLLGRLKSSKQYDNSVLSPYLTKQINKPTKEKCQRILFQTQLFKKNLILKSSRVIHSCCCVELLKANGLF